MHVDESDFHAAGGERRDFFCGIEGKLVTILSSSITYLVDSSLSL